MEKITDRIKAMVKSYGTVAVGIATTETLAGGPPSTDLTYVLPEARSAVTSGSSVTRTKRCDRSATRR